jgi:hypothetical protein
MFLSDIADAGNVFGALGANARLSGPAGLQVRHGRT